LKITVPSSVVISFAATRPRIFFEIAISIPESDSFPTTTCPEVPQSCSVTTTSCATEKSFRVRYPARAVLSAMSESPFREPCVVVKYSIGVSPSFDDESTGYSIVLNKTLHTCHLSNL
jgi:hypothetical protein